MIDSSTDLVETTKKTHPWHHQPFDDGLTSYKSKLRPVVRWKNTLNIGPAFLFIYDFHARRFEYVGDEVRDVLGYSVEHLSQQGISCLMQGMSEVDAESYHQMLRKVLSFFSTRSFEGERSAYSLNFDFQCNHADGRGLHILQQTIDLAFDRKGNIVYSLEKITDVSHRPPEVSPMLSVYGTGLRSSLIYVPPKKIRGKSTIFTYSEMRVLRLLNQGCNTREIANLLDISTNTVSTHRKNMLRKAGVKNTPKLIRFARLQSIL